MSNGHVANGRYIVNTGIWGLFPCFYSYIESSLGLVEVHAKSSGHTQLPKEIENTDLHRMYGSCT